MYVSLNNKYLNVHKKEAMDRWEKEVGTTPADLYFPDIKHELIDTEIDMKERVLNLNMETEIGFFSVKVPIDAYIEEKMAQILIQRLSKLEEAFKIMRG